jgi:hypothetical protein
VRPHTSIAALLGLAALASAPAAQASSPTSVKVRSCQGGASPHARQATFYARMRTVSGTSRMAVRFVLLDLTTPGPARTLSAPGLDKWRKSRAGARVYGYAQTVVGLPAGGAYAVDVQYRWLDARGHVVKTSRRRSGVCRPPGPMPNLRVTAVSARAGDAPGTETYDVEVNNSGPGAAHGVRTDLAVDGAATDSARLDTLGAHQRRKLRFNGPLCTQGLRVVVDPANTIHETDESDNELAIACPALAP